MDYMTPLGGPVAVGKSAGSALTGVLESEDPGTIEQLFRFISRPAYALRSLITGDLEGTINNSLQFMNEFPTGGMFDPDLTVTSLVDTFFETLGWDPNLPKDLTSKAQRPEMSDVIYRWGGPHPASLGWGSRMALDVIGGALTDPTNLLTGGGKGIAEGALTGAVRSMGQDALVAGLKTAPLGAKALEEAAAPILRNIPKVLSPQTVAPMIRGAEGQAAEKLLFQSIDPTTGLLRRWSMNTYEGALANSDQVAGAFVRGEVPLVVTDANLPARLAASQPEVNAELSRAIQAQEVLSGQLPAVNNTLPGATVYFTPRSEWRFNQLRRLMEAGPVDDGMTARLAHERDILRLRGLSDGAIARELGMQFPDEANSHLIERLMAQDAVWERLGAEVPGETLDAGIRALRDKYAMEDPAALYASFLGRRGKALPNFWSNAASLTAPGMAYNLAPEVVQETIQGWTTGVRRLFDRFYPGDLPAAAQKVLKVLSGQNRANNLRHNETAGAVFFAKFDREEREELAKALDRYGENFHSELVRRGHNPNLPPGGPSNRYSTQFELSQNPGIVGDRARAIQGPIARRADELRAQLGAAEDQYQAAMTRRNEARAVANASNEHAGEAAAAMDQAEADVQAMIDGLQNIPDAPEAPLTQAQINDLFENGGDDLDNGLNDVNNGEPDGGSWAHRPRPVSRIEVRRNPEGTGNVQIPYEDQRTVSGLIDTVSRHIFSRRSSTLGSEFRSSRRINEFDTIISPERRLELEEMYLEHMNPGGQPRVVVPANTPPMAIYNRGLSADEEEYLSILMMPDDIARRLKQTGREMEDALADLRQIMPTLTPQQREGVQGILNRLDEENSFMDQLGQIDLRSELDTHAAAVAHEQMRAARNVHAQMQGQFDEAHALTNRQFERLVADRTMKEMVDEVTSIVATKRGVPPSQVRPDIEAAYAQFQKSMAEIPPAMRYRLKEEGNPLWSYAAEDPFYLPHQAEERLWELLNEGALDRSAAREIRDVFARRREYPTSSAFQSALRGLADRYHIPVTSLDELQKWDIGELYLRRMHAFERTKFRAQAMEYGERMAAAHNLPDRKFAAYVRGLFAPAGTRTGVVEKMLGGGTFEIRRPTEGTALHRLLNGTNNPLLKVTEGTSREGHKVWRMDWAGLNRIYKPLLTSFPTNPKFHIRNTMSAVVMGAMDPDIGWSGVKATWDLTRNASLVRRFLKLDYTADEVTEAVRFLTDPDPTIRMGALTRLRDSGRMVGNYTWDEVARILHRSLGGRNLGQADMLSKLDDGFMQGYRLVEEAASGNPDTSNAALRWFQKLVDVGQNMANQVEHRFRVNATLELLSKGVPANEVVERVEKAFVNYDVNSNVERWIRDVFPFAKFMLGSSNWLKPMVERPRMLTALARARTSGERQLENEPGGGAFLPERAEGSVALPLPWRDKDGNLQFLIGLGLPQESALAVLNAATSTEGFRKTVGGALHPALRLPVEFGLGRSFYFDEPWGSYRKASPLTRLLPGAKEVPSADGTTRTEVPGAWNEILNASPLAVQENNLNKVLDERWGPITKALNVLTGIRTLSVDMKRELRERMAEYLKDKVASGQVGELSVFFNRMNPEDTPEDLKIVLREFAAQRRSK